MLRRNLFFFIGSLLALGYAAPSFAITSADMSEITGLTTNDYLANSVASGDFNGDGYQDIVTGTDQGHHNATQTGAVYIYYGSTTAVADSSISAAADATFYGENQYDWTGLSVSSGDFNGDGYDDILIGSLFYTTSNGNTGAAYVIYGQADQLTSADLSTVVRFTGATALDEFGYAAAAVGDLNNDGYDDMMISAPLNDSGGGNAGTIYLIYGQAASYTSGVISTIGQRIVGDNLSDQLGYVIAPAGDLNHDGFDDAIFGGAGVDSAASEAGAVYIVYGQSAVYSNPATANDFVRLTGEAASDQLGYSGRGVGDINNDGIDDMVIGSPYYGSDNAGAVYIFYGSTTNLTDGSISQGICITGEAASGEFGFSIASAGDLTGGDGNEFYASSPYSSTYGTNNGSVDLIWSDTTEFTTGALSTLTHAEIAGATAENFGIAMSSGDTNGDGYPELLVGATANNDAAPHAGALYVGYMAVDVDGDGDLASTGLAIWSSDCNDSDSTVSSEITYYVDADGDGLGDPTTATDICASIAPTGYSDNANDTNDTVVNNGVEISGDGVDNDGDGTIDEVNTVEENGQHPGYKDVDPTDSSAVDSSITRVRSTKLGKLRVTYADDSVYVYDIFTNQSSGKARLKKYLETGYYAFLKHNGSKVVIVNVLNGKKITQVRTISSGSYAHHYLQFTDLRSSTHKDLVITSKKGKHVRLYAAEVNFTKGKLKYNATATLQQVGVVPNQTTIIGNTIDLRSAVAPLASFLVNKTHQLIAL